MGGCGAAGVGCASKSMISGSSSLLKDDTKSGSSWVSSSCVSASDGISDGGDENVIAFKLVVNEGSLATRIILGADSDARETIRYDLLVGGVAVDGRGRSRIVEGAGGSEILSVSW